MQSHDVIVNLVHAKTAMADILSSCAPSLWLSSGISIARQRILFSRELLVLNVVLRLPCLVVGTLTEVGREVRTPTGVGREVVP